VSETAAHQVLLFDLNGRERFRIGHNGSKAGQFNFPTDLFIDKTGKLYVTDALNARIQVFSADNKFVRAFGEEGDGEGEFSKPKGVAVDSDGNIYVCDSLRDSVQIFDSTGRLLMEFGGRGQSAGTFWMPSGIYIDRDVIYVADTYNHRVQVFRYLRQDSAGQGGINPAPGK
jgi:DNA-binding beta-propeller fold protein YncE